MKRIHYLTSLFLCSLSSMSFAQLVTTTCMTYDNFTLGSVHNVGTNLTLGNIFSELVPFQWSNGNWTNGGQALVVASNNAMGTNQETNLNNINQRLIFSEDYAVSATLKYADFGGNVNLGINGTLNNSADMSDFDGMIVNDVQIVVTRNEIFGGHYGTVALIALADGIERFGFGGQEFFVDDVCVQIP